MRIEHHPCVLGEWILMIDDGEPLLVEVWMGDEEDNCNEGVTVK